MRKLRYLLTLIWVIGLILKFSLTNSLTSLQQQQFQQVFLVATIVLVIWWLIAIYRRYFSTKNAALRKIDRMDGLDFEHYCADLLRRDGFENVQVTSPSHDQGVDITADYQNESYGFQCKRYDHPVDNRAVQEVFTGCAFYHLDHPIVISNAKFTASASELAEGVGVDLINRDILANWIQKTK